MYYLTVYTLFFVLFFTLYIYYSKVCTGENLV